MNGFSNDAPDAYSPLKGKKVLIADRHTSTRMALRDMVNQLGVTNVLNAGSAGDVIRIVKQQYVDIILCEYLLDEVRDGQQLLEELRHEKLIPLHTMFMIITNERSYQQVVAVAEFAPDDYLLKPFTPSALNDRLLRANLKKQIFAAAYSAMEKGKADDALGECDQAMQLQPKFAMDAIRLKIDILTTVGRIEEAEKLLEKVLLNKATPWAKMGLAQVRYKQDRLSEAEQICENIIAEKGEFLAAYDFLAKVKQDLGKDDEALAVLERAGNYSSFNVRRLRATADVAKKTGDLDKAGRIYNKVIDRVRDSTGLLVLTQDGRIARQIIDAESEIEKEYLVRVDGELSYRNLDLLNFGLSLDGEKLKPAKVFWQNADQLCFILKEGKKRQIRRMCELVGLHVTGLKRVRIGNIALADLPLGQWRYLQANEKF